MQINILFSTFITFFLSVPCHIFSQSDGSYFGNKYRIQTYSNGGNVYRFFDFNRTGAQIRAKYFATNAYSQYLNWKGNKDILLIVPGAFSSSFNADAKPVGLTVDNGHTVNRVIDNIMDGMVIVYNGGAQIGGVAVVDLDKKPVSVQNPYGSSNTEKYYIRNSYSDRYNFIKWGENENVTLFQTQLLYSKDRNSNFNNLYYGSKAERRFLALCYKFNELHHVIIDAPKDEYLNYAAKEALQVLEYDGFKVLYIMNFDTGGKNILYAYNGYYLQDMKPSGAKIEDATNLLIYYKE